jgi:hypothetical protein
MVTEGEKIQDRGVGRMDRRAALLAWSLAVLSVALLVAGIAFSRAASSTAPDLPFGGEMNDASVVANLVTLLTFSVVGAIIVSLHPRNTIGWLFCSVGVTIGLNSFAGDYAEYWISGGSSIEPLAETAAWFSSWAWILLTYVPTSFVLLLFPDGRLPSPRWRPVAWGAALGIIGLVLGYALKTGPLEDFPQIANPYGVDSPIVGMVGVAGSIVAAGSLVASAISLIVRMSHAGSEQRQQIKWLAYGGTVVVVTIFVSGLINLWNVPVGIVVSNLALLGLPIFTGIAIVKHHLYDIDVLINRTLVYGTLTTMLVAVYVGSVVLSQLVFVGLTGHEELPQLAIVASTLMIAALFAPLRRRIQATIDRRFYRRKYDAAKMLSAFNARLRDETDLGTLSDELIRVVKETMQPEHVSLWLRPDMTSGGRPRD